jgi:hypothetical protein
MNKLEREGKIAVLYSPGYGAGWSTWYSGPREKQEILLMDADIVQAVLDGDRNKAADIAKIKLEDDSFYAGGSEDLEVEWISKGSIFKINEYDGSESVSRLGDIDFFSA